MITSIVGLMSSGKTLYMVKKMFIAYCKGKTVYTNVDVNFPHKKINKEWLENIARMGNENRFPLRNICIGIDEIWLLLDSRLSGKNTIATYMFLQSSKDDSEIYLSSQDNRQQDIRLRQNQHYIIKCSRVLVIDDKITPLDDGIRFLKPELNRNLYIRAEIYKRQTLGISTELVKAGTELIKASIIFPLYDTRQKIKGANL